MSPKSAIRAEADTGQYDLMGFDPILAERALRQPGDDIGGGRVALLYSTGVVPQEHGCVVSTAGGNSMD